MIPEEVKMLGQLMELGVEMAERKGIIEEQKKRIEYLEQLVNRLTKKPDPDRTEGGL